MEKHEMMDKIIQYQMRKISTSQVAKFLDEYTEALRQPLVSGSVADAVGRNCPFCGEPCVECSHKATDR